MKWLTKFSDFHVQMATLFERIETLSNDVAELYDMQRQDTYKIGRIEGAVANSANPEILRQISEINARLTAIEVRLTKIEYQQSDIPQNKLKELPTSKSHSK